MDVSVVIPAYNCELTIARLLDSLEKQDTSYSYEVIVVDNESSDTTAAIVLEFSNRCSVPLRLSRQPRGVTIATVRNFGASLARGRGLAFIDSDCEPPLDWIQRGGAILDSWNWNVLLAGGCHPPVNGTWVEKAWHSTRSGHRQGSVFVHGANFFIGKKIFDELGGFSPFLETSEDYDLGKRVSEKYKLIAMPELSVIHYGEANTLLKKIVKERWYSKNIYKILSENIYYKPYWMSVIFILNIVVMCMSVLFINMGLLAISLFFILFSVSALALFFCIRAKRYSFFIQLLPISFAYILGRSIGVAEASLMFLVRRMKT